MAKATARKSTRRRKSSAPRHAEASRARILETAKALFSQGTYEGVGVRDIAAGAGVDPALIMRYFGSKERLFREIAEHAFGTEKFLGDGIAGLPERTAQLLLGDVDGRNWRSGYNPLLLLLGSIGSPTAGPILAENLTRHFVRPLGEAIGGTSSAERGVSLAGTIMGVALMRLVSFAWPQLPVRREELTRLFSEQLRVASALHIAQDGVGGNPAVSPD